MPRIMLAKFRCRGESMSASTMTLLRKPVVFRAGSITLSPKAAVVVPHPDGRGQDLREGRRGLGANNLETMSSEVRQDQIWAEVGKGDVGAVLALVGSARCSSPSRSSRTAPPS